MLIGQLSSDSFDTVAVGRTVDVMVAGKVVVDSQPVVLARALGILDYIPETMPVVQLRHGEVDQENGIDDENAEIADHGHCELCRSKPVALLSVVSRNSPIVYRSDRVIKSVSVPE